jgi:hypothetical protein
MMMMMMMMGVVGLRVHYGHEAACDGVDDGFEAGYYGAHGGGGVVGLGWCLVFGCWCCFVVSCCGG